MKRLRQKSKKGNPRKSLRRRTGDPRGFTLIELLVVIAIISLLVSILLPSLSRARKLAVRVTCASQQHSFGVAFTMYANDFGYYPEGFNYSPTAPVGQQNRELYFMTAEQAYALVNQYGLDAPMAYQGTLYGIWEGVWVCPANDTRSRGFRDNDGDGTNDIFITDHYMMQARLREDWPVHYRGTLSPSRPEDAIGPIICDAVRWADGTDDLAANHQTGYELDGYNQTFSDGSVEWFDSSQLNDGLDDWTFWRGAIYRYYWFEGPGL